MIEGVFLISNISNTRESVSSHFQTPRVFNVYNFKGKKFGMGFLGVNFWIFLGSVGSCREFFGVLIFAPI